MTREEFPGALVDALGGEVVETHISWVVLAGDRVYKVKKPVVFPFLDYGTAERRRRLCEEEVRLNRRLAPDLYLGVRGLARRDGSWALVDPDDPAAEEWAVEMRRFDEGRTLASLLAAGRAGRPEVERVARLVARFHGEARVVHGGGSRVEAARRATADNFDEVATCPDAVPSRRVAGASRFVESFLATRGELLERRARDGFVRDCHGDLRAEHVVIEDRIEIFDCVEFASRLREIDVAADLAFLVMDLAHDGRDDLAAALVTAYRDEGGDPGEDALVSFFAAYRAWVRAKVACIRGGPAADESRAFADTARRFEWRARGPLLLVVCGASGTGKTHLAGGLARASGWKHLGSDVVRKELRGLAPTERAPADAYTPAESERTYAELARRARPGTIVDATFRFRRDRAAFLGALRDEQPLFVECRVPPEVLAERAAAREADPERVSDAGLEQIELQQREFEPLDEVPPERRLILSTDRPLEELVNEVEAALDSGLPIC